MGVGLDFTCKTCKKSYYMGYGSYGLWITPYEAKTVAAWDSQPANQRDVPRNRHFRDLLEDHDGHDWTYINWDAEYESKGHLWIDGYLPSITIEHFGTYERINLQDAEPRMPRVAPLPAGARQS